MAATAEVIDLSAARARRAVRQMPVAEPCPAPMLAWVPVWFFTPLWFLPPPGAALRGNG